MNYIEEQVKELMDSFKCIQNDCDNNGTITVPDENGDPIHEQCQFCFEIRFPLKDKIKQALQDCRQRTRADRMLELADAQLLGFVYGSTGIQIEELIDSMGLDEKEWKELNKKFDLVYLTEDMRQDIIKKIKGLNNIK